MVGDTEPKSALPGTIRAIMPCQLRSSSHQRPQRIKHTARLNRSQRSRAEIAHWFTDSELHDYETVHERFTNPQKYLAYSTSIQRRLDS